MNMREEVSVGSPVFDQGHQPPSRPTADQSADCHRFPPVAQSPPQMELADLNLLIRARRRAQAFELTPSRLRPIAEPPATPACV
jgi:hypothetical protein